MNLLTNETILDLTLRMILGILFFFQGYDKIFRIKMTGVIDTFKFELGNIKFPNFLLVISAYYTSYVELIGGLFLVAGLFTNYTLYLIGIDLILVTGAFSLIKPVWDMNLIFPRLILWSILMIIPESFNKISIDFFIK